MLGGFAQGLPEPGCADFTTPGFGLRFDVCSRFLGELASGEGASSFGAVSKGMLGAMVASGGAVLVRKCLNVVLDTHKRTVGGSAEILGSRIYSSSKHSINTTVRELQSAPAVWQDTDVALSVVIPHPKERTTA